MARLNPWDHTVLPLVRYEQLRISSRERHTLRWERTLVFRGQEPVKIDQKPKHAMKKKMAPSWRPAFSNQSFGTIFWINYFHWKKKIPTHGNLGKSVPALWECIILQSHEVMNVACRVGNHCVDFRLNIPMDDALEINALNKIEQFVESRNLCARIG